MPYGAILNIHIISQIRPIMRVPTVYDINGF